MNDDVRPERGAALAPLVISRAFAAPCALVFKAWSSADHMKRWFSPEGCSVPEAEIDFRPGGAIVICMRMPDGQEHWSRGVYEEIAPPERLTFAGEVAFADGRKFGARTVVTFEEDGHGTLMTVRQEYEISDTSLLFAAEGAPEGWRTTLDKLEREVARLRAAEPRSAVHASFSVERVFAATPTQVFRAFADKDAKARWFAGGDGYALIERAMDVRPGGRERVSGRWASGMVSTFDAVYFDVVPDARLVYAYEMHLDDRKISVSLATVDIQPAGAGTRVVVTEQGVFLDGYEDAGAREHGTGFLLDQLGASLRAN
jgi:uncharacterized protein YndB with AHSA1/START domain